MSLRPNQTSINFIIYQLAIKTCKAII